MPDQFFVERILDQATLGNSLLAHVYCTVEDFRWEVELHEILQDAKNECLAAGDASYEEFDQHVQFSRICDLLNEGKR